VPIDDEQDESELSIDDFVVAWAAHERASARLALAVGRFDQSYKYAADGAVTIAAWLRHRCRMSDRDAAALVARGRFLRDHQPVAEAALDWRLSAGHVQALSTNITHSVKSVFDAHAAELVAIIAPLDVRATEQACRQWRRNAEAITEQPEPAVPERQLTSQRASDGSLVDRFVFDDALAAEFEHAIGTALTWETDDQRTAGARHADALFDVVAFFNANHHKTGTPRHRPHIELAINADNLGAAHCCATTSDGEPLPASTTEALLCDSMIQRFVMNGSVPIDCRRRRSRHSRSSCCSHQNDPLQPTTLSRGPSDHAAYTNPRTGPSRGSSEGLVSALDRPAGDGVGGWWLACWRVRG
jgi:hypothetical protein